MPRSPHKKLTRRGSEPPPRNFPNSCSKTKDGVGLACDRWIYMHELRLVHAVKGRRNTPRNEYYDDSLRGHVRMGKNRRLHLKDAPAEDSIQVVAVNMLGNALL